MRRPPDLFDREQEWGTLADFARSPGPGIRLALVRGRRRQGKSYLLRRLVRATDGFYFQAAEEERAPALRTLGAALGGHSLRGGPLALTSWDDATEAITNLGTADRPTLVVLDEFPYLLAHSPELPSVLQRAIDRSRDGGPAVRLVLCGSAVSAMAGLLGGTAALRGRAVIDLTVPPFDMRTAAKFWSIDDPATAFVVNAVLGGTPGYRDLLPGPPPRRAADIGRWLATGPLNPAHALFREDEHLLGEDGSLTDRSLYRSVLRAIADGNTTQSAIAATLGREQRGVQHPLRALELGGFVSRTDDVLRARRPIYRLDDPIIRFHQVVTRRELPAFEERRIAEGWERARTRFATHVLGPRFEEAAREFVRAHASNRTLGGRVSGVGPAVVNDATGRAQHEIDVVAIGVGAKGERVVLALGEAKHTAARRTVADLGRLERIRSIVSVKEPTAGSAKLLLFSASGFDRRLTDAAAGRRDVELIDLARMYAGR